MVEIIPKIPRRELPWKKTSVYLAGSVLLVVIFSYFLLLNFETNVSAHLRELEEMVLQFGNKEDKELEAEVLGYEKKIRDFSQLWAERVDVLNFFGNFEKIVHPNIWFSTFNLDLSQMQLSISGTAPDFRVVHQQLLIFKNNQSIIQKADLTDLSFEEEGDIGFSFSINFKPEISNSISE